MFLEAAIHDEYRRGDVEKSMTCGDTNEARSGILWMENLYRMYSIYSIWSISKWADSTSLSSALQVPFLDV